MKQSLQSLKDGSTELADVPAPPGDAAELAHVAATAELFLKIREAHDKRREIVVEAPF